MRQYETTPLKCYWERGRSVFHRADKIIHLSLLSQPEAIRSTSPHIADRITQADPHWPLISAQYDGEWNVILYNIPVALKSHSYCKITTRLDYFGNVAVSLKWNSYCKIATCLEWQNNSSSLSSLARHSCIVQLYCSMLFSQPFGSVVSCCYVCQLRVNYEYV